MVYRKHAVDGTRGLGIDQYIRFLQQNQPTRRKQRIPNIPSKPTKPRLHEQSKWLSISVPKLWSLAIRRPVSKHADGQRKNDSEAWVWSNEK